jgi:hypothetical protein
LQQDGLVYCFAHKQDSNNIRSRDVRTTYLPVRDTIDLTKFIDHFSNRLRATRSAAVEQQESSGDVMAEYLGYEGQDFQFGHLECEVMLTGCSVENGELNSILEWIVDLS